MPMLMQDVVSAAYSCSGRAAPGLDPACSATSINGSSLPQLSGTVGFNSWFNALPATAKSNCARLSVPNDVYAPSTQTMYDYCNTSGGCLGKYAVFSPCK
jgi:hypothetical protein